MDEANVQFRPGTVVTEAYLDQRLAKLQEAILEAINSHPDPGPVDPDPKCDLKIEKIETI